MPRTAVIVTSYNRPALVRDCLESIREQRDPDWICYVMDDGSNAATCESIRKTTEGDARFRCVRGRQLPDDERRASLRYSRTINIALTQAIADGARYACAVCDDDYLYPEAVGSRADYLDAHSEAHVVYGRLRAIPSAGTWGRLAMRPKPGRTYVYPTGRRELTSGGYSAQWLDAKDPETSLGYVDEGFWQAEPLRYGQPFRVDHNQAMWRLDCLTRCRTEWFDLPDPPRREFWPEARGHVGDAAFFEALAALRGHEFHSVPQWVATKRYHAFNDGAGDHHPEVRE